MRRNINPISNGIPKMSHAGRTMIAAANIIKVLAIGNPIWADLDKVPKVLPQVTPMMTQLRKGSTIKLISIYGRKKVK
jgi:hypothetical protein